MELPDIRLGQEVGPAGRHPATPKKTQHIDMDIPNCLREFINKAVETLRLTPSEMEELETRKRTYTGNRRNLVDSKTEMEAEVQRIEAQLRRLDDRRQTQHGVLQRATTREMQGLATQLGTKEKDLYRVLDHIQEIDLMVGQIDRLLGNDPIDEWTWEGIGSRIEETIEETRHAKEARRKVEVIKEPEHADSGAQGNLERRLAEIPRHGEMPRPMPPHHGTDRERPVREVDPFDE